MSLLNFFRQKNIKWRYVSIGEYSSMVHEWIKQLPTDFDIVIAIPRSGMVPGAIIATELSKPLASPEMVKSGFAWGIHGNRVDIKDRMKFLLVDDSFGTGNSLKETQNLIHLVFPNSNIIKAALFGINTNPTAVDFCYHLHDPSLHLIFEFNLTRLNYGKLGCDMDGVLCRDYTISLPEPDYLRWITDVPSYKIPNYRVESIITNRREKDRKITEDWLRRYNVDYGELIMNPGGHDHQDFKIKTIKKSGLVWYWESDPILAKQIFKATGVTILCINSGEVFSHDQLY